MSYNIHYIDRWSGESRIHRFAGTTTQAIKKSQEIAEEHSSKVMCERFEDDPFNNTGKKIHIITIEGINYEPQSKNS